MRVPKFTPSFVLLLTLSIANCQGPPPPGPPQVAPPPAQYYGVNIPIGAGIPQTTRGDPKPFGQFPAEFTKCGLSPSQGLNPAFVALKVPSSVDVYVDCEPTPTRILTSQNPTAIPFSQFKRDFKQECEMFMCTDTDVPKRGEALAKPPNMNPGTQGGVLAPEPELASNSVCGTKTMAWPGASGSKVLFANEGNCYDVDNTLKHTVEELRNSSNERIFFSQFPRWLDTDKERINLRHFYFSDEKPENLERVPFVFPQPSAPTVTYSACDTTCDRGTVVKLAMRPNSYQSMVYVNPQKCDSFRICFSPDDFNIDTKIPTCNPDYIIDVLFKNGVVVWAKKGRASVIELMNHRHDSTKLVAIEFGYGVELKETTTVNGKTEPKIAGEFYVGNDHREFVTSDSGGYEAVVASKLAFFFPDENCLVPTAGIFSKNIETGKTFSTGKVSRGTTYKTDGSPITVEAKEKATTTTEEPSVNLVRTTTPAALRVLPQAGLLASASDSEGNSQAVYSQGKWWTWGVYLGFLIGTLLTLGIGGGVFYLLRRTVFSVWYRGMYKRYGCDASGTTGGITGIGFGNTQTALTQTIAPGETGNTMGGTTAGGTTGGSTMGTTGGGTTGGTSSTSGASTIAM